jgi:hypothetical protein
MFIENKYKKWYFEIIQRSLLRDHISIYENHHIIPKSLGGSNTTDNLAKLSAREHFLCHRLLTKMTVGVHLVKMKYALWCMTRNTKYTKRNLSSRQYELARSCFISIRKYKTYNELYGIEKSLIIRKKRSESTKGISRPWAGSNGLHPKTGHNRAAKVWEITDPNGKIFILTGSEFTDFCKMNNLSKGNFSAHGNTKGFYAKCLGLASKLT